jgi:C4-dicarboxylate transporter, DctQ subunit
MEDLKHLRKYFDNLLAFLALLAALLMVFIILAVDLEVITRYVFNSPIIWVVEVTRYCLLFMTFLGTAWVLKNERHVSVDLVLNQLSSKTRALITTITSLLCAAVCLILTFFGAWVTLETYQLGYLMASELEPPQFIIHFIVPVGFFLLSIQFLRRTYLHMKSWKEKKHIADEKLQEMREFNL